MIVSIDTIHDSPIIESIVMALAKNNVCSLILGYEPGRTRVRHIICFVLQTLVNMNKIENFIINMNDPKFIQIDILLNILADNRERIVIPVEMLTPEFATTYEVMYS